MAAPSESSYLWTTGGAGDGASTYTTAGLSNVWKVTGCVHGDEGVGDYGNHYDATGSTGGEVVTIDTGAAIVDGKPHMCSVAGDITVAAAVGAGNTRIDRIVLRADWTAQTVRLTCIAGTDAASPSAPAVTTTSGTTYDVLLYQVTVNTSGDVSISTDERAWATAQLAGDGLTTNTDGGLDVGVDDSTIELSGDALQVKDAGITLAKMAANSIDSDQYVDGSIDLAHMSANSIDSDQYVDGSIDLAHMSANSVDSDQYVDASIDLAHLSADCVDDTKVGNRVPQLYRRQGGSATDWDTSGTTTYTPTTVRMQCGTVATNGSGEATVTFPTAFSAAPIVLATMQFPIGSGYVNVWVNGSSTTCSVATYNSSGSALQAVVHWLAIGPE